jgi:N-acetylglucosaminyl-diphospho-decaprenol L-rhamnosyltransferase
MTASPRVAAVIVHYGDPAPTLRCLDSLEGIDEVVLVDQPPRLCGAHARVTTRVEPGTNLGFAAACNRGVAATNADFVLLVNNDAVLAPDAAAALVGALPTLGDKTAGACLKLLGMDGETIQSAGGLWFTRDGIGFPRGFGQTDRGQFDRVGEEGIGVPSGAAALYRREAWIEAGGMAAEFFCYCEDGDLGLAMIAAGQHFAWFPEVRVLHELSSSSGAHSAFKAFHVERNHFAAMVHTAPFSVLVSLPLLTLRRVAVAAVDALRGRGAGSGLVRASSPLSLAVTLLRAWKEALTMTRPAIVRRRRLLARHPDATRRVGRFLADRRVALSEFSASRDTSSGS